MQLTRATARRVLTLPWPDSGAVADVPAVRLGDLESAQKDAAARFDLMLRQYDRLIVSIVARLGRQFGLRRDSFTVRDDIAQEVRFDLWKQVARGVVIEFPATYIYRATIRETVRALRRAASRDMEQLDEEGALSVDPADPFKILVARDQLRLIHEGVAALASERRQAVEAHLTGFQFQELMSMHGWTYQKARNLVSRGMADLRERLGADPRRRRSHARDSRLSNLQAQLDALRAGMRALRESRQETVRLEHTVARVRK
jgi:DNA-directed RNA polymerase specialized sigma24 family protein